MTRTSIRMSSPKMSESDSSDFEGFKKKEKAYNEPHKKQRRVKTRSEILNQMLREDYVIRAPERDEAPFEMDPENVPEQGSPEETDEAEKARKEFYEVRVPIQGLPKAFHNMGKVNVSLLLHLFVNLVVMNEYCIEVAIMSINYCIITNLTNKLFTIRV